MGRLVPDHFLVSKKVLYEVKTNGHHLDSMNFGISRLGNTIKTN